MQQDRKWILLGCLLALCMTAIVMASAALHPHRKQSAASSNAAKTVLASPIQNSGCSKAKAMQLRLAVMKMNHTTGKEQQKAMRDALNLIAAQVLKQSSPKPPALHAPHWHYR